MSTIKRLISFSLYTIIIFCKCGFSEHLKYLWGDALNNPSALSPEGNSYPWELSAKIAKRQIRHARNFDGELIPEQNLLTPEETRKILLQTYKYQDGYNEKHFFKIDGKSLRGQGHRQGRSELNINETITSKKEEGCVPSRLCQSTYNTTAPLFGVSLTSGKPVTIVQKFPDLLQQVVFQVCKSTECEVIQGDCVQTFIPHLFLVIPLGPVSMTGQDYILVENGCNCQPRYAKKHESPPLPFAQQSK